MIMTAAFQGSAGAFSEDAARALLGEAGADPSAVVPCRRFEDVFDAVRAGAASVGVIPVENTLAGSVQLAYDLLRERELVIVREHVHRIEHCLLAPAGSTLEQLQRVLSHPVALAQCRGFFAEHPWITPVAVHDTAGAVEMIMRAPSGDEGAIASRRSGSVYGASVLAHGLEDDPANFTRFLVVAADPADWPPGSSALPHKTSLVLTLPHRPGALANALQQVARRGVDLTMIESRPRPGRPFEYAFYVDLTGSLDDPDVRAAVADLRRSAQDVQVLGSYPRAAVPVRELPRVDGTGGGAVEPAA